MQHTTEFWMNVDVNHIIVPSACCWKRLSTNILFSIVFIFMCFHLSMCHVLFKQIKHIIAIDWTCWGNQWFNWIKHTEVKFDWTAKIRMGSYSLVYQERILYWQEFSNRNYQRFSWYSRQQACIDGSSSHIILRLVIQLSRFNSTTLRWITICYATMMRCVFVFRIYNTSHYCCLLVS